jgi:hypothetical protein
MLMRFAGRLGTVAAIMTLGCVAPTTAHAQVYKCKDASGAVSYKDAPCAQTERAQPTSGDLASVTTRPRAVPEPGKPGLWEKVMVMQPRASHPGANPQLRNVDRKQLENAGDYKYLLGVPMKTQECTTTSPIEALLPKWGSQCDRQIKARAGTCETSERVPGMSGARESSDSISGDYRSELQVNSRFVQGKDATGKAIYDTSEMHIRYLGPCKTDMRPGDVFLVQDDGRLVKQR